MHYTTNDYQWTDVKSSYRRKVSKNTRYIHREKSSKSTSEQHYSRLIIL